VLRLPYFWDEAGYYVPAARDVLLTGSLIPTSTLSNAHPPLLLVYLAGAWTLFGYSPLVTRCAMLLVSAFCLLGVFRLARRVLNAEVAIGSVVTLALFPVYFAQSSMAHMDLGAAAFIIWGLDFYVANQRWRAVAFFAAAAMTKETAVLVPLALFVWEVIPFAVSLFLTDAMKQAIRERANLSAGAKLTVALDLPIFDTYFVPASLPFRNSLALLSGGIPLAAWFAFHYSRTGFVFGNPEFFRYNAADNFHITRIVAALALHLWHLLGYMSMALFTAAVLLAMTRDPLATQSSTRLRPRIAIPTQLMFSVVILAHLLAFSVLGGAVLARYLLPIYPLVVILGVSTLRRRLPWWPAFVGVICLAFAIALTTEPPYRFAPEDNLAYSDYVRLHQSADRFVAQHFSSSTVLTAWPAADELRYPWLGYVEKPVRVMAIENFSVEQLLSAADMRGQYRAALLFSTKEEPRLLLRFGWWERLQTRYFGYHRDLRPTEAAQLLGGRIVFTAHHGSQWVAVLSLDTIENARHTSSGGTTRSAATADSACASHLVRLGLCTCLGS